MSVFGALYTKVLFMNLVILHGWQQQKEDLHLLSTQLETLEGVKSITVLDLPGFGKEPLKDASWGVPEYSHWVSTVIEGKRLQNVVIIGHSFGGRIASFIGSKHPKWLSGLVLSGSPSIYRPEKLTKVKTVFFKLLKPLRKIKLVKSLLLPNDVLMAEKAGLGSIFRKVVVFDQTHEVQKIQVPTLIIWGENDQSVPLSLAKELSRLIPKSKLIVIPHAGHNTFISHPNLFFGYVKNFIENL